jgi:hypothetical protein
MADLKADSERWDAERRQRGQPSNGISSRDSNGQVRNSNTPIVEYRSSTTHQSRQYYGPSTTDAPAPATTQGYSSAGTYTSSGPSTQSGGYDSGYQMPQYTSQQGVYGNDPGYSGQDGYQFPEANLVPAERGSRAPATQAGQAVPRTGQPVQYQSSFPPDSRGGYSSYTGHGVPSPVYGQPPAQQQSEAYYGRGAYNQALLS